MALSTQIRELVDAFSELVAQHVRLAKMELADDAKFIGARVGLIAVFVPLILVGYGCLCVAVALGLSTWLPLAWAFVVVGVANLITAGVGIAVAGKQLSERKVMSGTVVELETTSVAVVGPSAPGSTP